MNSVGPSVIAPGTQPAPVIDLIPQDILTATARDMMKKDCIARGLKRAAEKRIINTDYSNAVVRALRPTADLNFGVNSNQNWTTTALVAGTRNNIVNSFAVPTWQIIVLYGISTPEPTPSVCEVRVQRGTAGQGGILSIVGLQAMYEQLEVGGYFSKAILYDPQDVVFIDAMPFKANAAGEVYVLHGYAIEPIGQNIAAQPD